MRERDIFTAARSKPEGASRAAFLDEACGGDQVVRQRVERLLQADATPDVLIDHSPIVRGEGVETTSCSLDPSLAMGVSVTPHVDDAWRHYLAPSDRPSSLGRIGHYDVMQVLGTGGFGVVVRAQDLKLNRDVAVKMLAPHLAASSPSQQRFLREARAMAAIRHKNVVQVYAVEEQPLPYVVMEFLPGETLQQRLDRTGPLPVDDVIEIGRQIADGLAAAHATGLIHRDIKPANVFLESAGHEPSVKLLDFGLARAADDVGITKSGTIIGTPLYMSPEQVRGESLDGRSDLFSLGSVLYATATGRSPFQADDTLTTLRQVCDVAVQPIGNLAPDAPPWLCDLVMKLLAKNPRKRFDSARAVADALTAGRRQNSGAASARHKTQAWRWLVAAALAAVFVFGVVLSLRTPNGEVIVEVPDHLSAEQRQQIKVEVNGDGDARVINAANGWTIGVKAGKYVVELRGGDDLVQIEDKQVTVTRGKQTIVRVTMKPLDATASRPAVLTSSSYAWPADAPRPAIAPFDAEQARRHQEAWAKHLGVPVEYTNRIGMKFVLIPPGEFTMGSPPAEIEAHLKELRDINPEVAFFNNQWRERIHSAAPQHKVVLSRPIYLGSTEVTQQQYETVMGKNPAHFSPTGPGKEAVADLDTRNLPVERVSWNDAAEFCARRSKSEQLQPCYDRAGDVVTPLAGNGYRLPTEAEWEFACRAGTTTKFWSGDADADLTKVGWTNGSFGGRSHAVGELRANPFGLFDVHGNLLEWVEDAWVPQSYGQFSDKAAIDPVQPNAGHSGCVIRGGSWGDPANNCRASTRHAFNPPNSFNGLGFRVKLTVEAVRKARAEKAAPAPDS